MRRSHDALPVPAVALCSVCGALCRPHHVCSECYSYNGRVVIDKRTPVDDDDEDGEE